MPTYVYACDSCGKQFEQFQSFKDEPLTVCPSCQTEGKVRRVIQPAGVVFKGSGWYITDSRGSSSGAVTAKAESAKAESAKAEEPKAEAVKSDSASESTKSDTPSSND